MIRGFTDAEIKKIKKMFDSACREKTKLIEVKDMKNIKCEEIDDPEQFYKIRWYDKGLCIVKTKYAYHEESKLWVKSSKEHFAIEVFGYVPSKLVTSNELYYNYARKYGCYETIKEAKEHFRLFLVDFMQNQLKFTIHEHMELFTTM